MLNYGEISSFQTEGKDDIKSEKDNITSKKDEENGKSIHRF